MMSSRTTPAWIGNTARDLLTQSDAATVIGVTSRGVFLQLPDWVVFLSGERFRGPLTLNLPPESGFFSTLRKSDYAQIIAGKILLGGWTIPFQDTPVWDPPILNRRPDEKARNALKMTVKSLEDPLFTRLISDSGFQPSLQAEIKALDLVDRMAIVDWDSATTLTLSLLGLGSGLTPEGDDFLIGLAFCLRQMFADSLPLPAAAWLDALPEMARPATTQISANLLACAAHGQADERLYHAFRALSLGEENAGEAVQELLGWGNTSGRMALAGIIAGLMIV